MQLGNFSVDAVDTCIFSLDGGSMFGVVPKALWARDYNPGDELNRIPLAARPLLIRGNGRVILVDTGNGNIHDQKFASIYNIDLSKATVDLSLSKLNVTPEDITDVILTHLHFDHAGGATKRVNGELIPAFPNARYYVQRAHLDHAHNPTDKDRASFLPDTYEPLIREGRLDLVDGETNLFEGISVIPMNGHTTAMQLVKISSGNDSMIFCADLFPTAAHVKIPYVMGYDNYPITTIKEKKEILALAYEDKSLLFFEHDAFTQAASIVTSEKGFKIGEKLDITKLV